MDPFELAFSIIGTLFIVVYCILYVLILMNRSETGKEKFFNLSYQFGISWLLSPELYNEKGNRYRKILLAVLIVGVTLLMGIGFAAPTNTK